jgi:hypothetical protein
MRGRDLWLHIAAILIMVAASGGSAAAGTKDGRFAVEDAGRTPCAAFVKAREKNSNDYARYLGFIEGYLTAANRYEPNTFDLTPWHNSAAFGLILDQHCRKNGSDNLVMAAQRLVIAMQPLRLADYSSIVAVGSGQREAQVYQTILKRAQWELSRRGLYRGQNDGKYSPAMKTALEEFQRAVKLDPTGVPDTPTLWVLLNP